MVVDVTVVNNLTTLLWAAAGTAIAASLSVIGKVIADICSRVSGRRAERRAIAATIAGEIGGYLLNLNSAIIRCKRPIRMSALSQIEMSPFRIALFSGLSGGLHGMGDDGRARIASHWCAF
jgi:hypothetical protein